MLSSCTPRRLSRLFLAWLAAAGCVLLGAGTAPAQLLRWAIVEGADPSRPVIVRADSISAWSEADRRVFRLSGNVWLSQGLSSIRCEQGVIRIEEVRQERGGHYLIQVYAEGQVEVDAVGRKLTAPQAHVLLKTTGDLKFKASDQKILQRSFASDPVFVRARQEFATATMLPPAPQTLDSAPPDSRTPPPPVNLAGIAPVPFPGGAPPRSVRDASIELPTNPIQPVGGQLPQPPAPPAPPTPEPLPQPQLQPPVPIPPGAPPGVPPLFKGGSPSNRTFEIRPRSSLLGLEVANFPLLSGETAVVVSSGVILTVYNSDDKGGVLDIEADRLVFWTEGNPQQIIDDLRSGRSQKDRRMEFYLSGHVEIRMMAGKEARVLRADEVYYDVNRHVAIATNADLEVLDPKLINPVHLRGAEIYQLGENLFEARQGSINASALPLDPGIQLTIDNATLETRPVVRKTIFGREIIDRRTGQPVTETERYVRGQNVFLLLNDIPVFYLPYIQGDATDPLGPLENVSFNYNKIFGFQLYTTWDMHDLIGVTANPGTEWRLLLDVLTARGPAIGTDYLFEGVELFGIPNRYKGTLRAYGIYDTGDDIIGGGRGQFVTVAPGVTVPVDHPNFRGRVYGEVSVQDLPYGFMGQARLSAISDKNFLEQYFLQEFQNGLDQDTYVYVKQQQGSWAWTGLVQPRVLDWFTDTEWYPRFDGYVLGLNLFDVFSYNLKASAGYAELEPTDEPPFAFSPTDVEVNTGRFDLWQELSAPFPLGPVKVVPYGIVDLTYYSEDVTGNDRGRVYGAAGVRSSLPLSRLYPEVYSQLFNLDGIYHKIVLHGNFYNAQSDTSFRQLPQLDRFNDDASDQALRDIRPLYPVFYPGIAAFLNGPLFDPQAYALRRLILNRIDTRDDIQVLQVGVNQRWQTKRGFPGRQHVIDWMTLNLSASVYPNSDRDNFGETFGFLEYDWTWNIGDRTSLVSSGWIEPVENGPRVFTFGGNLNRPDGTNFYLGYRQIDPLDSKMVIGAVTYQLSRKYSLTASTSFDFGIDNQVTTVVLTRSGADTRVSLGFSYNSILNNFGVVFEIMPNLFANQLRSPATPGMFTSASRQGR